VEEVTVQIDVKPDLVELDDVKRENEEIEPVCVDVADGEVEEVDCSEELDAFVFSNSCLAVAEDVCFPLSSESVPQPPSESIFSVEDAVARKKLRDKFAQRALIKSLQEASRVCRYCPEGMGMQRYSKNRALIFHSISSWSRVRKFAHRWLRTFSNPWHSHRL
jgi:hypothetical protein